jgi:hypothetical protein
MVCLTLTVEMLIGATEPRAAAGRTSAVESQPAMIAANTSSTTDLTTGNL